MLPAFKQICVFGSVSVLCVGEETYLLRRRRSSVKTSGVFRKRCWRVIFILFFKLT
jgi:hypothetical protein